MPPPRVSPVFSASTSPLGAQTSAPVPSASAATPPMWSTSVCVTRIAGGARSQAGELEPERRRVVPGIDHRRLRRAALGADDVAVRLERSHHEAVDDERHEERLSVGVYASAVQRWDLHSPAAPNGTRDPIVLHSDDAARAVLIVLQPGQELGEHQVKENAWVTVIDGEVDVDMRRRHRQRRRRERSCGSTRASGTRCAARTARACLLLLSPWPGAGPLLERRALSASSRRPAGRRASGPCGTSCGRASR